jgi:ABC-2 type transport system permease protein
VATRLDPLSYGVDGLRSTLIGVSHFGLATDALVLIVGTILFLLLGRHLFSKIQV